MCDDGNEVSATVNPGIFQEITRIIQECKQFFFLKIRDLGSQPSIIRTYSNKKYGTVLTVSKF